MTVPADLEPPSAARAGAVVGGGKLAAGLLSVAATVLAARLLEPADYGRLALVLVSSSVLYAVLASWSSLPVYVLAAEELRDDGTMSATSAARLVVTGLLSLLVAVLTLLGSALGLLDGVPPLLVLAWVAAGLGYTVCEHVTSLLETRGSYGASVTVQTTRAAAWALGLGGLVLVSATVDLDAVLWVLVASWAVASGLALALAARLPLRPVHTTRRRVAALLAAAAPLVAYSVSQLLFGSVDLYVLQLFATTHDVGVYGLAYQCFSMGALLSSAIVAVVTPRLAGGAESPAAVRTYLQVLEHRGLPLLGAAAALLLPWVVPVTALLFGAAYEEAGPPLVVLGVAFLALVATTALAPVLLVRRNFRAMAAIAVGAVVLNAVLDLLLVGVLGLGVVAPAAATTVSLVLSWLLYRQQVGSARGLKVPAAVAAPVAVMVASLLLPWPVAAGAGAALAAVQLVVTRRAWSRDPRSADGRAAGAAQPPDERA